MQTESIRALLRRHPVIVSVTGGFAVSTHCLYPSNQAVTVFVSGGPSGFRVDDGGGATDTLSLHGYIVPDRDRFLMRFCRRKGLLVDRGKIHTRTLPPEGLAAGVVMVANASAAAAHWGVEHIKPVTRPRDLHKELHDLLANWFGKERVQSDGRLTGMSNRQYHFGDIVTLNHDHRLVIDSVLPDANSINSRVIAHWDVGKLGDLKIIQRIVYDDELEWQTADLTLLQMAATVVPYSGIGRSLSRLQDQ